MENSFKSNLNMLKELILDEDKLVTYISLSKELCIHVNEAKSLLNHIVQDIRKMEPKTEIHVCYIISGLLSNNSGCTTVCSESEIETFRKTLNIVFYEHVYCVSKGMQDVDNAALTAINKLDDFPLCTGLIKANSCSKRSDNEISNLKSSNNIAVESKSSNVISKNTTDKKKEQIKNGHDSGKKTVEVKSEPVIKSKTPSPKKEPTSTKTSSSKNGTKPTKSIAGFFSKANGEGTKAKNTKVKEDKPNNKIEIKLEKEDTMEVANTDKNISVKTEINEPIKSNKIAKTEKPMDEPIKSNKKAKTEEPAKNSLKEIKKNAKVDKKHKRLLRISDSESDTETNDPFADDDDNNVPMTVDNESEDEIPPTPTVQTVKITSGIINPKKRRKIVDKTYTDEDGYILTKKEEVYESCSDNEEEIKISTKQEKENVQVTQVKVETSPKDKGKSKRKKVSPPQKGKQQTLTSFFKKV